MNAAEDCASVKYAVHALSTSCHSTLLVHYTDCYSVDVRQCKPQNVRFIEAVSRMDGHRRLTDWLAVNNTHLLFVMITYTAVTHCRLALTDLCWS